MQKKLLTILLVIIPFGILTAQSSISSSVTTGLFTNALDAAASADVSTKGIGFTDLDSNYLFTGIMGNPTQIGNDSSAGTVLVGYFNTDFSMPFSIFTNATFSSSSENFSSTDDGEENTTKSDTILFDSMNGNTSFLIDIGMATTGLEIDYIIEDKRLSADNGIVSTENLTKEVYDKNGSRTDITASVPFYMETGNLSHFGILSYGYLGDDYSSGTTYTGDDANDDVLGNYDLSTTRKTAINTIGAFYKVTLPMGPKENLFSGYTDVAVELENSTNATENNDPSIENTTTEELYSLGFDATLGAKYYMNLISKDWLTVRAQPDFSYNFSRAPYMTNSTTSVGNLSTSTYTDNVVQSSTTNTFDLDFDLGMKIKPQDWKIGFMAGSSASVSFASTTTKSNTSYLLSGTVDADITTDVVYTADDEGMDKTTSYSWGQNITTSLGVYFDLPENYTLEVSVNGTDIFDFEDLTVQVIIPLDDTKWFSKDSEEASMDATETE